MNKSLERSWIALTNSDRFRRFAKRGVGSIVFRSRAYQNLKMAKSYVISGYASHKNPALFQDVQTYCVFVGHNKSGTSLIGALLDAHPEVIMADEEDALQYVSAGFTRDQIFHILLRGSRREAMKGRVTARRLHPYAFAVPGQWQGQYRVPRVVGDGTVGASTRRFANDPNLLQRLRDVMGKVDVRLVQVIRNPYDPITISMVRGKRTFEDAVEHFFTNCEAIVALHKRLDSSKLFAVKYEDFVLRPEANLIEICRFLGVEADQYYLNACASILHRSPDRDRHMVAWNSDWIGVVKNQIERFDFLKGYAFEHYSSGSE